jgi:hypothetical protein
MAFTPTVTDNARIQSGLTEKYINQPPEELLIDNKCDPALKMIEAEADNKTPGAGFVVQLVTRGGTGPNPLWAEAGKSAEGYHKITVPAVDLNWRAKWTRQAMVDAAGEGSKGIYKLADSKIMREIHYTRDAMAKTLEGDGWGTLCKVSSNDGNFTFVVGTATATPVPALSNRFYKNQRIQFAANPASGNLVGADPGTIFTVTDVDPSTGTVTVDTDLSTATVANGYSVHEYGYRPYSASNARTTMRGFDFWLPLSAITDSLDPRYQIPELQPLRFSPTGTPSIRQYLLQLDEFSFTQHLDIGEKPVMLIAPQQFRQLAEEFEAVKTIEITRSKSDGTTYKVGVPEVEVMGMRGPVPVRPSAYCTPGIVRYGDFEGRFKLLYAGEKIINVEHSDGRVFRLNHETGVTDNSGIVQSGFSAEGYSRIQLVCTHPGSFVVGSGLGA